MKMIGRIDPDAPLDYVELQIFPSQNRYEAFVCSNKRAEKVASGALEQLLLRSPRIKDLLSKGSNTNFKILPPDNVNDAEWFTTATFTRFLHIICSRDIVGIGNEIIQLEETKMSQLSLFGKVEVCTTSSVDSKNELLRAVDLRLTALKDEIVAAFDQSTNGRCSIKDISDLENFAHHLGAKDIRDSLQKLVEMSLFPTVEEINIKEDQPSVETCRAPTRSSTPRRSASPMRRVQIGRSGSRKAAALTIKSLSHLPVREKVLFSSDQDCNTSDEDDPEGPTKQSVLRLSVKDKINLFESKQRDQKMDVLKTKTLFNKTNGANKTVLRRWSSGMGTIATQNFDTNHETFSMCPEKVAPEPEFDTTVVKSQVSVETEENIEPLEPLGVNVDTVESENKEHFEKHPASIEWSQQTEAELNQLFIEMMENKPVSNDVNFSKQTRDENLLEKRAEKVSEANSKQKSQKKSNPLSNSGTDTSKPSVIKKATSKTSLPATRKSWSSMTSPRPTVTSPGTTPTSREAKSASSTVRSTMKSEKSKPRIKTLNATPQDANRILKTITEKKNQSTLTKITKSTKAKIQSPEVNTLAKPSFCNKATKKSSVVPLETKPFLRKGCGIGHGVGPDNFKTKVICEETSRISETQAQTEENKVVMTTEISEDLDECEATELTDTSCSDSFKPQINTETEKESPVQFESPIKVVAPAGTSSLQVRRSLSQMLLEDNSEETDIGEWGNAEHLPVLIYEKNSPKGLKKLLKLARKSKSDFHPTRWSSASVFLDRDDGEVLKGQPNMSEFTSQNHPMVPEVSASMNATKATRSSLFSLSTFRGNKTTESKLT